MGGTDFWSRRKAGVETEEKIALQIKDAEETAALQAEQAEKTDEELLLELDLPNPDDMKMGDDFSAFMSKAVPDRLRRRALRRLWLANPALANLDGLLDYGEDFTDSATVIENLQTAYQVGKGMTEHVLEMVRQAEAEAAEQRAAAEADELISGEATDDLEAATGCWMHRPETAARRAGGPMGLSRQNPSRWSPRQKPTTPVKLPKSYLLMMIQRRSV